MIAAWTPQEGPQLDAITATWCRQLFYGGARGGGKSDYMLGDYLQDVPKYQKHWQGLLIRRRFPQFKELKRRSAEVFPQTGGEWKEGKGEWRWPNGATLRFAFLENDGDAQNYQGHQYTWIGWEELGNFPSPEPYKMLLACNRWAEADIPTKRIRASGNPGGPGQAWIKTHFIDHAPLGFVPRKCPETGHDIMFVPARVSDNKILLERDPEYINTLRGSGSPALVRAWLDGDFNAVVGGYFPEFGGKHILDPFEIPSHWTRFRAIDWGSYRPFVVLWCAVSDGSIPRYPPNTIIVYREWYGGSEPNVGLKLSSKEVAEGIKDRQAKGEQISYSVIDPAAFNSDDGPSTGERLTNYGVSCHPADNKRVVGWQRIRDRLRGIDGKPMLYVFSTCLNTIRTIPSLQHDERKPEDVDTEGDDHCADALRYGCMSRPYTPERPKEDEPIRTLKEMTYGELIKLNPTRRAGHTRL
jgi:hypothetical protein